MPFTRLAASMVASVEVTAFLCFLIVVLPRVSDLWVRCLGLVVVAPTAFYLHYR